MWRSCFVRQPVLGGSLSIFGPNTAALNAAIEHAYLERLSRYDASDVPQDDIAALQASINELVRDHLDALLAIRENPCWPFGANSDETRAIKDRALHQRELHQTCAARMKDWMLAAEGTTAVQIDAAFAQVPTCASPRSQPLLSCPIVPAFLELAVFLVRIRSGVLRVRNFLRMQGGSYPGGGPEGAPWARRAAKVHLLATAAGAAAMPPADA